MAEDELEALEAGEDGGMKQHDGLVAAARGPPRTRDLLRGAWHGLLCVLGRPLAPVEHPALSYYFHDVHVTRSYCPEKVHPRGPQSSNLVLAACPCHSHAQSLSRNGARLVAHVGVLPVCARLAGQAAQD